MTLTTNSQSSAPASSSTAGRLLGLAYGAVAYVIFLVTFLCAIGFVSGFAVPKTVDTVRDTAPPPMHALVVNLVLLAIFAIQHSGMARRGFKHVLTKVVSPVIERSTYVLFSSLALILLFSFWQPLPETVWRIDNAKAAAAVYSVAAFGWLIVLYSTFLISHFELFGLKQVTLHALGRVIPDIDFKTPGLYRVVRHPIYLGFLIAFWAAPVMTFGHLLFAAATTAYIFIGIALEERDLVAIFGDQYRQYRARVAMLLPKIF
ncbi:methanethiol S-methyltransferase [Bradyrhizobium prioriisuperbiae]|uniref:methanethiol S-methyltransferase n=1 Tax=Bradyrhizobium prioriisuperbiae TaxID=2854389 RepID=UPI0028EE8956|nr:methanethiol S-methyltransferase [Bradyrhizobium prioritasuperba]